jgi:hypothetical protein
MVPWVRLDHVDSAILVARWCGFFVTGANFSAPSYVNIDRGGDEPQKNRVSTPQLRNPPHPMGKETMRRANEGSLLGRALTAAHLVIALILAVGWVTAAAEAESDPQVASTSPGLYSELDGGGGQIDNVPDSDTEHPAHIEFTWIDGYRLPEGCQREAAHEIRRLFLQAGIEVDWELPGVDGDPHSSPDVQVILMDSEPEAWGLDPQTLASALNEPGGEPNPHVVFVFMPNVLGAMTGSDDPSSVQEAVGLGTVLGRLVAETTVQAAHSLHGESGLVTPVLSTDMLLDPNCCLDYAATRSLWFLLLMQ